MEWLGFSEDPPDEVSVRLKDVESYQVLEEKRVNVEIFL
jgi:hypothetical protein